MLFVNLDESGSMGRRLTEVIEDFNNYLDKRKKMAINNTRMFMIKFNTSVTVLHQGKCFNYMKIMDKSIYFHR